MVSALSKIFCKVPMTRVGSGILLAMFFILSARFFLRPYDVTATSVLLFHSFMQYQLICVRDVIFPFLLERSSHSPD